MRPSTLQSHDYFARSSWDHVTAVYRNPGCSPRDPRALTGRIGGYERSDAPNGRDDDDDPPGGAATARRGVVPLPLLLPVDL